MLQASLSILAVFFALPLLAQVRFDAQFQPNQHYMISYSQSEVVSQNVSGDEAMVAAILANDSSYGSVKKDSFCADLMMETYPPVVGDVIPFQWCSVPGKVDPACLSFQDEVCVRGHLLSHGAPEIDTVMADPSSLLEEDLLSAMGVVFSQVPFPDRPLYVGDTFMKQVSVPMGGAGALSSTAVREIYQLKEMNDSSALFEVKRYYEMQGGAAGFETWSEGNGKGYLRYSREHGIIAEMFSNDEMVIHVQVGEVSIQTSRASSFFQQTRVKP